MEYYPVIKWNRLVFHATTWINLKGIMLEKVNNHLKKLHSNQHNTVIFFRLKKTNQEDCFIWHSRNGKITENYTNLYALKLQRTRHVCAYTSAYKKEKSKVCRLCQCQFVLSGPLCTVFWNILWGYRYIKTKLLKKSLPGREAEMQC